MARKLIVEIVGDASSLQRSFKSAEKSTKQFGREMDRAGRGGLAATVAFQGLGRSLAFASTSFLGGAAVGSFFKGAVSGASDLNEQMSKSQQVFGASADEVRAWSETTAAAFGISQRQALGTASSFGALFAPMGLIGSKAEEQSRRLTELGADLASFYNTDVQDALDAIRSGIVGESEPLRRYGVLLSESRVQAEALAETHKRSVTDLTAAEKALARITLIMRDTTKAQGDFARTSDGLANQTRKLRAEWDNLSTHIGATYVPFLAKLTHAANDAFEAFSGGAVETPPSLKEQALLIPDLARKYGIMRERGVSAADTIRLLERSLGDSGKAAILVGDAINYFAGGPLREKITKLRIEVLGLGTDADTAAKSFAGLAQSAAQMAAAAPRGVAAITPTARAGLGVARAGLTVGTADDLAAFQKQHELYQKAAQFAQSRLAGATGKAASRWAETLRAMLEKDASVLDQIRGIQGDNAQKMKDVADKQKAAAQKAAQLAADKLAAQQAETAGWAQVAADRAALTPTLNDDLAAVNNQIQIVEARIRAEGYSLELVQTLVQLQGQKQGLLQQQQQQVTAEKMGWAQLAVDRAGLTATYADDLKALAAQQALIVARIQAEGHTLELEQALLGVQQTRKGIIEAQAAAAKAAADAARAAAKQRAEAARQAAERAREAARTARETAQFGLLGFGPGGAEKIPGVEALKNMAGAASEAIEGTFLDTKKTRSMISHIRQVLSGGLGAVGQDIRSKIKSMLNDIDNQLEQHAGGAETKFRHVSTSRIVQALGLDLTKDQVSRLRSGLATLGPGMTVPAGRPAAFALAGGGGVHIAGGVHLHGVQNVGQLENELHKRANARPQIRRGAR